MWSWNQFKNLPRNRDLSPAEQSRQYFIYQSNMMYEASINNTISVAAAAAAAGSGGGSGLKRPEIEPTAIQVTGKSVFITYVNESGNWSVSVLDYTNGIISTTQETTLSSSDYSYYAETILDNKGVVLVFVNNDNHRTYVFVDAGGNIIKTKKTDTSSSRIRSNIYSLVINYVSGENENTYYWWCGETIFKHKFAYNDNIVESINGDRSLSDGSHICIFNNTYFVMGADGSVTDITGIVNASNVENYEGIYTFCHYNATFFVFVYYFMGLYRVVKIISNKGELLHDLDISSYSANNFDPYGADGTFGHFYGTNKFVFICNPDNHNTPFTIIRYNGELDIISTTTMRQRNNWHFLTSYTNKSYNFDNRINDFTLLQPTESPAGAENFVMFTTGTASSDGHIGKYADIEIAWDSLVDGGINKWEYNGTFSFTQGSSNDIGGMSKIPTFFVNDGSDYLQLMFLTSTGVTFSNTGTTYSNSDDYYSNRPIGDLTVLSYYDNSRTGDVQFFGLYDGVTLLDYFWTTTNNDWSWNYDTLFIGQFGENKNYYVNNHSGAFVSIGDLDAYDEYAYADNSNNWDYIGGHKSGSTYFYFNGTSSNVFLTSNNIATINIATGITASHDSVETFITKDFVYYMYRDLDVNKRAFKVYDKDGVCISTIITDHIDYNQLDIVSERVLFIQNVDTITNIWFIGPEGGEGSFVTDKLSIPAANEFHRVFNDYRKYTD